MSCRIVYREQYVPLNNAQFSRLIDLAIDVGRGSSQDAQESQCVERMIQMRNETFWPGRGIDLEKDFPVLEEQKFWARVLLDTARAIFERRVGQHDHAFWQAQCIWQTYGAGILFQHAVRSKEPHWCADSIDQLEFDRMVNGINRNQ
jgi:hypothetical protein